MSYVIKLFCVSILILCNPLIMNGQIGLNVSSLAIDPTSTQTLYVSAWQEGVIKSNNGGSSWYPINTDGTAQIVYALAIDPINPQTIYAGYFYGVLKSINGGISWTILNSSLISGTKICTIAVAPSQPQTVYAGGSGAFKSTDGGNSWSPLTGLTNYGTVSYLAIDPAVPQTIYIAMTSGIFKSSNGGVSWTKGSGIPSAANVYTLCIDPSSTQTLYAGTNFGVFKSIDGGLHWGFCNTGMTAPSVYAFAIDPGDPRIIYAATFYGMFKSTTAGEGSAVEPGWYSINSGLPAGRIYALAVDPQSSQTIYAGTDHAGVYKSTDGGANWLQTGTGLSLNSVSPQSTTVGGQSFALTVYGTAFSTDATVYWNSSALQTTFMSATQLSATIPASFIASSGSAQITVNSAHVTSNSIQFVINPAPPVLITITASPAGQGLWFMADGIKYSTEQMFSWIPGSTHTISTGTPQGVWETRFAFANWSDGGEIGHTITVLDAITYTATFGTQSKLIISISPSNGGSISVIPSSPDGYYTTGTVVQLTATANPGYVFSGWSYGMTGTANPQALTLSAPCSVLATFASTGSAQKKMKGQLVSD
jgi:photosystem II stability/assembly factor-like uncharacterized protein